MALNSGIQTFQILTIDDEVCIPSLSSIISAVPSHNFCSTKKWICGLRLTEMVGRKMVLRLQVPKVVPKNESLVTKRHIEIPQRFRPKTFCAWTFKIEKSNQNLSQKMNSWITEFLPYFDTICKKYSIDFPKGLFTTKLTKRLM